MAPFAAIVLALIIVRSNLWGANLVFALKRCYDKHRPYGWGRNDEHGHCLEPIVTQFLWLAHGIVGLEIF